MKIKSVCCNPQVIVDLSNRLITIEGHSKPQNARHHYEPLLQMLQLSEIQEQVTKIIFSIRSIDQASLPFLTLIIGQVSHLIDQGAPIKLIWLTHHDEEESTFFAHGLQDQFHLEIKPLLFVETDM